MLGPPVTAGGAAASLALLPEEGGHPSPDSPAGPRAPGTLESRPGARQWWEDFHWPSTGKADTFCRVLSVKLAFKRTRLTWGPWASEQTPSSGGRLLGPGTSPCPPKSIFFWVWSQRHVQAEMSCSWIYVCDPARAHQQAALWSLSTYLPLPGWCQGAQGCRWQDSQELTPKKTSQPCQGRGQCCALQPLS